MVSTNLDKMCTRVLAREIDFTAFVRGTRTEFERFAQSLLRRWPPPSSVGLEDVLQELRLGAWATLFGKHPFDPARGVSLARYVTFNAMSLAKRMLHKARMAKLSGSADRNPSQFERPLSSLGDGLVGDWILENMVSDALAAEDVMISAEERAEAVAKALKACISSDERIAILALRDGGDVDGAVHVLYSDFDIRIALRLGSEERALRYIMRGVERVAARLSDASAS